MADAYRANHGPTAADFSRGHAASGNRYGYDHVFVLSELRPVECDYLHAFRLNGNHHVAILAELAWE